MTMLAVALFNARKSRKERQDITAFNALVAAPGDLAAGVVMPANVQLYVACDEALADVTALLTIKGVDYGAPASDAGDLFHVGWIEKDVTVTKKTGAPGTVSIHAMDGIGVLRKVAEG